MNRSTFWMIKYMNGSVFSKARYKNGVGFEILALTPVPQLPLSYPPPPRPHEDHFRIFVVVVFVLCQLCVRPLWGFLCFVLFVVLSLCLWHNDHHVGEEGTTVDSRYLEVKWTL